MRQEMRCAPNTSLDHINAKFFYGQNHLAHYIKALPAQDQAFIRRSSRKSLAEGRKKARRLKQAHHDELKVTRNRKRKWEREAKRAEIKKMLKECVKVLDICIWQDPQKVKNIRVAQINLQLRWHAAKEKELDGETKVSGYSKLDKKGKIQMVIEAVQRWGTRTDKGSESDVALTDDSDSDSDSEDGSGYGSDDMQN
ncbi:hypothetical protein HGRIS_004224 [Hohenbuehelia grisea]|uniref:Uncharacterized protein n=1 Tax=Hohenbuehelia grisea TaxID=104357 RepID=A0ABR3JIH3_9AGAR